MTPLLNLRTGILLLSLVFAVSSASAQVDPCKGSHDCGGSGDDPIFPSGGNGGTRPPSGTPEPFTVALGLGAVGLYARRKMKRAS